MGCSFSRPSLLVEHPISNGFQDISFLVDNYIHKIVSIYPLARSWKFDKINATMLPVQLWNYNYCDNLLFRDFY